MNVTPTGMVHIKVFGLFAGSWGTRYTLVCGRGYNRDRGGWVKPLYKRNIDNYSSNHGNNTVVSSGSGTRTGWGGVSLRVGRKSNDQGGWEGGSGREGRI